MPLELTYFGPEVEAEARERWDDSLRPRAEQASQLFDKLGIQAPTNEWFLDRPWKRSLAGLVYGDLLEEADPSLRVLEVGGGLAFTTLALQDDFICYRLS